MRAIRRRKEQDQAVRDGKMKRNDLRYRVQRDSTDIDQMDNTDEFEELNDLEPEHLESLT